MPRPTPPSPNANPLRSRAAAIPYDFYLAPDNKLPLRRERLDYRHRGRSCADQVGACDRGTTPSLVEAW